MKDLKTIYSHSPSIVSRKTGNEFILVPVTDNIADMNSVYTLNETGAFIWESIDGKKNLGEIIQILTEEYDVSEDTAEKDVFEFIERMTKGKFIDLQH